MNAKKSDGSGRPSLGGKRRTFVTNAMIEYQLEGYLQMNPDKTESQAMREMMLRGFANWILDAALAEGVPSEE